MIFPPKWIGNVRGPVQRLLTGKGNGWVERWNDGFFTASNALNDLWLAGIRRRLASMANDSLHPAKGSFLIPALTIAPILHTVQPVIDWIGRDQTR